MTSNRQSRSSTRKKRKPRKTRPESLTAKKRRLFSESVAGIDNDVQQIFLKLPKLKLAVVLRRYELEYGVGAFLYANRTYPHWRSGEITMSGIVAERLLNLVPLVLDAGEKYELVKKLRNMYMPKEHRQVSCSPSNWFKLVNPVIDELISLSESFQLPPAVVKKVQWVMQDDALAAQALLAQIEMDQAKESKRFLPQERHRIGRMLENLKGTTSMTHTIVLPQGTVTIITDTPKQGILQKLKLASPSDTDLDKRTLFVTCKNPKCCAELETTFRGYDGEPIVCEAGNLTCQSCGLTYSYDDRDLHVVTTPLTFEIRKNLRGRYEIFYNCPICERPLISPIEDTGISETCPKCQRQFTVPKASPQ